jgi:hypothetical protein
VQEWIGRSSPGKNVDGEVGGSGVNARWFWRFPRPADVTTAFRRRW